MPTDSRKIDETSDDDASLLDSIFSDPRGVADFTKLSDEEETPPILSRIGGSSSSHRNRIGSLFQESSRRNRRENSVVQMDSLERRLQLSDTPLLHAEDIAWPAGKDDGKGLLGVADILSGSNLYGISASPDGSMFVVTGQYKKASIVDAKTGAVITSLQGHNSSVISSTWSPDGKSVFTASYDGHVRQYSIDGTLLWDSGNIDGLAIGVDVSPDGKTLIICGAERIPTVVDLTTKTMTKLAGSPSNINDTQALNGSKILVMENDAAYKGPANKVILIDQATGTREWAGSLARQQATSIVATDDGQFVFAGADDGKITMFNSKNNTSMTLAVASSYVRDLTLDPTGTMLIAAMQSDLRVYDLKALMTTDSTAMPSPYVFAIASSAVSVNGSVIFVNNTKDGSASRTMAVDLRKAPNFVERLKVLEDELEKDTAEKESGVRMKWVEVLKTVNFSDTPAKSLAEGEVLKVPVLGSVGIFRGGPTPVRVTESGSLMTGINQGHATVRLNPAAYIESITVKKSGNGKGLFNFGNGYITLNSGETTIPVNREISEFSAVVYDTAVVEITGISVKGMELVPDPIFVLHEQDLLDQSVDLLANIDTLTKPWSIDPANRMTSLTDRTIALRDASVQLVAFLESFDIAADSPDVTAEQMSALRSSVEAAADAVLLSMEERDSKADELWNLGLPDVSPALLQALLSQNDSETIRLLTSDINLADFKREKTSTSVITDTLEMQDIGGAIKIHGLQVKSNSTLAETIGPIAGAEVTQSINFSHIPAQNLKEGATLTLPVIGNVVIYRGGFTPVRVTESGGLGTGLYEGHATIRLEKPTYIESITVRKSGSGKSLFNFGNGYIVLNDGENTINVGREINEFSAIVYDTSIVEITGINVKTTDGPTGITETGQALSLDFASLTSPVVSTSFVVTSSQPTDTVKVSLLSGSKVIETRTVLSGDLVDFEHAQGITGVIVENAEDSFAKGTHHPVSISQLSVTSNMGEEQDVSELSAKTNPLFASLSLPKLETSYFRYGDYPNITPIEDYQPNSYNVYNLQKYTGGPYFKNVQYKDATGTMRALPKEFYEINGNTLIVYPSGQEMRFGISVDGGKGYSPSLRVGEVYDYDIVRHYGADVSEALPPQEAKIEVNDITLMNYNSGGNAGWRTGSSLQYSGVSPVAIGTIKARAQIENKGQTAINFTVKVYSGNVGIDGWDRLQYSYKGSLGAGDSRGLVTPVGMNTDSQGRSYVRFVVIEDNTGKILAEGGRTVGAAGGVMWEQEQKERIRDMMEDWKIAMQKAKEETDKYLASIGITPPPVGDYTAMANAIIAQSGTAIPVADVGATERKVRIAYRALEAAKASGDLDRIALEEKRLLSTVAAHDSARSITNATPGAGFVYNIPMIIAEELGSGGALPEKLKSAEETVMVTREQLEAAIKPMVDKLILRSQIQGQPTQEALEAATTVSKRAQRQLYSQALDWIPESTEMVHISGIPLVAGKTVAGRIIGGAAQELWKSTDESVRWNIAFMIQQLTDIPASKFMKTAKNASNAQQFVENMKSLMVEAQYEHLLDASGVGEGIVMAALNKTRYDSSLEDIRVRFDLSVLSQDIKRVTVYVGGKAAAISAASTFILIPQSAFEGLSSEVVSLEVELLSGKIIPPVQVGIAEINFAKVIETQRNFLHISDAMIVNPVHQKIVNSMMFPVSGDGWSYGIYSSAHTGALAYSLDLNATNDDQAIVKSPVSGRVRSINLQEGKVLIDSLLDDGSARWATEILHMDHIFEKLGSAYSYVGIAEFIKSTDMTERYLQKSYNAATTTNIYRALKDIPAAQAELLPIEQRIEEVQKLLDARIAQPDGLIVEAGKTEIGQGGNEGLSQGAHIHMHAKDSRGNAVPLFGLAETYKKDIPVYAEKSRGVHVSNLRYDKAVGMFSSTTEQIYATRELDGRTLFFAKMEDGRKGEEIVWVEKLNDGTMVHGWLQVNNLFKKWNSITQEFES